MHQKSRGEILTLKLKERTYGQLVLSAQLQVSQEDMVMFERSGYDLKKKLARSCRNACVCVFEGKESILMHIYRRLREG